jgi:DNA-binding NarL/FixJ family response regulator
VEEALAGRQLRLKERTIALGALERDEDFDPRFDAIVRIVAGKLRRTLERYYFSEGATNEIRITIPKGGYVPQFVSRADALKEVDAATADAAMHPGKSGSIAGGETSVLLVDDHHILRGGLRMLLDAEPDMRVIGEADNGQVAIDLARELSPDVVVMDIAMPRIDGVEATRRILADSPDVKVVALSVHAGQRFVEDMLRAGAKGYVLKESAPEELVAAIRTVVQGRAYLSPTVTGTVVSRYVDVTSRDAGDQPPVELTGVQKDLLRLIVEGHSTTQAAAALCIGQEEADSITGKLMKQFGVESLEELAIYAQTRSAEIEQKDGGPS